MAGRPGFLYTLVSRSQSQISRRKFLLASAAAANDNVSDDDNDVLVATAAATATARLAQLRQLLLPD